MELTDPIFIYQRLQTAFPNTTLVVRPAFTQTKYRCNVPCDDGNVDHVVEEMKRYCGDAPEMIELTFHESLVYYN